jgi:uncharacterized membrane protein
MSALTPIYLLIGALFAVVAWRSLHDRVNPRRHATALFWGLLALVFVVGDWLPAALVGAIVIVLAVIAGLGGVGRGGRDELSPQQRRSEAQRHGHRLFAAALLIPLVTVAVVLVLQRVPVRGKPLLEAQHLSLVALTLGCLVALAYACRTLRAAPAVAVEQARGLIDAIGWALILPLVLATLGSVFTAAGVGEIVARHVAELIPIDSRFACVLAYALGMAVFTTIMGNAFAAFPVMTGGIALPLLVQGHAAEATSLAAIGMLSGYCGTLLTPMAANFNIVPALLLDLEDKHAVIKAQTMTGLVLLAANVALMYFIVFR